MSASDARKPKPAANSAHRLGAAHARHRIRRHRRARRGDVRRTGSAVCRGRRHDPRGARPRHRHRHGQIRPCRAQDRGDACLDRHAGILRSCRRREPRRSRHDHVGRRDAGAVLVGRDRGAQGPDQLFPPLPHRAHRHHGECRKHARQGRRYRFGAAGSARSLPAQSRADDVVADAARARRRPGDGAARKPRLHGDRLRRVSSRAASSAPR